MAVLYGEKNYLLNRDFFGVGHHISLFVHHQGVTIIKHTINTAHYFFQ
jgi:hypothetical protein